MIIKIKNIGLLTGLFSILFFSCSTSRITSTEFVPLEYQIISHGDFAKNTERQLIVTYNKYFNQDFFSQEFIEQNYLDTVNYNKNMVIEILLGEKPHVGYEILIEKIEENKDLIKIHYTIHEPAVMFSNQTSSPYVFIVAHKSRKQAIFYENGEEIRIKQQSLYINN